MEHQQDSSTNHLDRLIDDSSALTGEMDRRRLIEEIERRVPELEGRQQLRLIWLKQLLEKAETGGG